MWFFFRVHDIQEKIFTKNMLLKMATAFDSDFLGGLRKRMQWGNSKGTVKMH